MIRFSAERIIATLKNKYSLFRKIPWNLLDQINILVEHAFSTINQFQIGKIYPSEARRVYYNYMKVQMLHWPIENPLKLEKLHECLELVKHSAKFKTISTRADLVKYCPNINDFILDDSDICLKAGGEFSFIKGTHYLWQSKTKIQIHVGTQNYSNIIVVTGIYKKYQVCLYQNFDNFFNAETMLQNKVVTKKPKVTNVLFTIWPHHIVNPTPYNFSQKCMRLMGICSNISGSRHWSYCSHLSAGLKFIQMVYAGETITDPTPRISNKFRRIRNIARWVGLHQQLDPKTMEQYMAVVLEGNYEPLEKNEGYLYDFEIEEPNVSESSDDDYELVRINDLL